jgi:hypothetical protein
MLKSHSPRSGWTAGFRTAPLYPLLSNVTFLYVARKSAKTNPPIPIPAPKTHNFPKIKPTANPPMPVPSLRALGVLANFAPIPRRTGAHHGAPSQRAITERTQLFPPPPQKTRLPPQSNPPIKPTPPLFTHHSSLVIHPPSFTLSPPHRVTVSSSLPFSLPPRPKMPIPYRTLSFGGSANPCPHFPHPALPSS